MEEVQQVQEGIELDVLGEVEEKSEPDVEYMPPRAVGESSRAGSVSRVIVIARKAKY